MEEQKNTQKYIEAAEGRERGSGAHYSPLKREYQGRVVCDQSEGREKPEHCCALFVDRQLLEQCRRPTIA